MNRERPRPPQPQWWGTIESGRSSKPKKLLVKEKGSEFHSKHTHQKPYLPCDPDTVNEKLLPWNVQPPQLCTQHTCTGVARMCACVRTNMHQQMNELSLGPTTTDVIPLVKMCISHFKPNNRYQSSFEDKALVIQATPLRRCALYYRLIYDTISVGLVLTW